MAPSIQPIQETLAAAPADFAGFLRKIGNLMSPSDEGMIKDISFLYTAHYDPGHFSLPAGYNRRIQVDLPFHYTLSEIARWTGASEIERWDRSLDEHVRKPLDTSLSVAEVCLDILHTHVHEEQLSLQTIIELGGFIGLGLKGANANDVLHWAYRNGGYGRIKHH